MLFTALMLTPYLALAACFILTAVVVTVCVQSGPAPKPTGFGKSNCRRRVPQYRGAVHAPRMTQVQDAA